MSNSRRDSEARAYYYASLERMKNTPVPKNQKYLPGTRVRVVDDLGPCMRHFPSGVNATVKYTYAMCYGGKDVKSYCIHIDNDGEHSWYDESQLIPLSV